MAPDGSARWCGACGAALQPETAAPSRRAQRNGSDPEPDDTPPRDRGRLIAAGLLVAVVGGLLVTQAAEESPPSPAGFTVRGDAARSGIVSTEPVPAPSGIAWTAEVALPPLLVPGTSVLATTHVSDPSAAGPREVAVVLAPSTEGQRIAVHDAQTGELGWTTMLPLGSQPWDTDVFEGLLAHRTLQAVTLLDLGTQQRRWTVDTQLSQASTVTPAGVVGVPAGPSALALVLLSAVDGSQVWRWQSPTDGVVDELYPLPDAVLVDWRDRDDRHHLTRVELATGQTRWDLLTETLADHVGARRPRTAVAGDSAVLTGTDGSVLLDLTDGTATVLPATDPLPVTAMLAVIDGEPVVVQAGADGQLTAFDSDGVRWTVASGQAAILGLSIGGDRVALRGDSAITLVSLRTGELTALIDLEADAPGSLATAIPMTADGWVLQLRPGATLEAAGPDGAGWRAPTIAAHLPDMVTDDGALAITIPTGVEVRDVLDGSRRFAHDAFDSELVGAGTLTAPALARGRVMVSPAVTQPAERGGMMGLFADDGTTSWSRDNDGLPVRGTPVVSDDLIVLAVGSQLHGYRVRNGSRALVLESSAPREHVAIAGDTIVATDLATSAGDVWGGRPSDSTRRFRIEVRTCAPPTIVDDRFLIVTDEGDIFARSVEDGEAVWGERAGGSACRPFSIAGQTAVSLVDDRTLLGVGLISGETTWRATLGAAAAAAPVVAGETLLVPTMAGLLEAWEVGADAPTWTIELGGIAAGAAAVEDGTIMVLLRDGRLVGLR